jgi:enoyl-CoA hydratase
MDETAEVLFQRDGVAGRIILNRPRALNSLTFGMVTLIAAQLEEWAADDSVETVVVTGAGDRGLCAGGDIVALFHDIKGDGLGAARFWADEYRLNAQIAAFPKPYVAIMDGVVLGGGVGVSAHGSIRVVTERTRIGMPEVGIGFTPDVGGTWLLARAPGELGTHAALTGGSFTGADALELGLADYFVPSENLSELLAALASGPAKDVVAGFATEPPTSDLAANRAWIDELYAGDDAAAIVAVLESSKAGAAREAASVILTRSPTSVAVTLAALRRSRTLDTLEENLSQDYRLALHFAEGTEMLEGIRAQVIDKDRQPKWSPDRFDFVTDVDGYFADLGDRELQWN